MTCVDEYVAKFPGETQEVLAELRTPARLIWRIVEHRVGEVMARR